MSATVWPRWLKPTRPLTADSGERLHRGLDARPREEVGVLRGPEARGVLEGEGAEVVLREQAALDELEGLLDDLAHVAHVPVPDVRADDRVQLRAERVRARVEGPGVHRVVGLAAEVEARHEEVVQLARALDAAGRELVERIAVLDPVAADRHALDQPVELREERGIPVLAEEAHELVTVELRRVVGADGALVPLLPVRDQVGEERAGPGDAALEEGEAQAREAPRDTAQEERLAGRLAGGREVAGVVVDEARERAPRAPALRTGMEGRRDAELGAARPDRVVVAVAVEAERVDPGGEPRCLG